MDCRTITVDPDVARASVIGRKTPAEIPRIELDWSKRVDCAGTGVTITNSVWSIHPDDDDASLTLDQQAISALVTSVRVTGGTDGVRYRLVNTVTTSDQLTLAVTVTLPVRETLAA